MKRVLVTGAAGFIGHHTVEHLLETTDWEIVGLVTFRHRGDSVRLQHLLHDRVKILYHDLTGPLSSHLIEGIGHVDYVLNIAAESHVDRSITDPVPFVQNNVALILNMLEYARIAKPEVFIQISTDEVYGPALIGYKGHSEGEAHRPSNPYSASKSAQEAIAYSYWRTFGVPVVITNTMNNFGERQDAEKYTAMLMRKIAVGEEIEIHAQFRKATAWNPERQDRWVPGSRMYLHARNHADALRFLCERGAPSMYPSPDLDRWNVVGDREVDNLEMAQRIANLMALPLAYKFVDFHSSRPGHDPRYALDGSKLRSAGWRPPVKFEDSLLRTVEWTLTHRSWL